MLQLVFLLTVSLCVKLIADFVRLVINLRRQKYDALFTDIFVLTLNWKFICDIVRLARAWKYITLQI